ncbi:MAG: polyketide cyclase [Lachnospiraceae bacterium]|nr:polyketide cyclase [Lachnospiraceae bacterium]
MVFSRIEASFDNSIEEVWNAVTSKEDYSWRSNLDRIEVINDRQFIEYTKDGYATVFTTTVFALNERWEFDMENDNMKGHWVGVFTQTDGWTHIDFFEEVTVKKLILKPFAKLFLKKQQEKYVSDLRGRLNNG